MEQTVPGKKKVTKLDRCVAHVKAQGKSEDAAYAICNTSLNEATGDLWDNWEERVHTALLQLEEAMANASDEDISRRLSDAVSQLYGQRTSEYGGPAYAAILATYDDHVVFMQPSDGHLYQCTYVVNDDGTVTLGPSTEVIATYEPVQEAFQPTQNAVLEEVEGTAGREWDVVLIETGLSKNGRYYPASVLRKSVPLFEGVAAYADHPTAEERQARPERSIRDKVGVFSGAKYGKFQIDGETHEGITARFKVLSSWLRETLMEAVAANEPTFLGFSINGLGEVTRKEHQGQLVTWVESLEKIQSVDVVTDPAGGGRLVRLVASNRPEEEEHMTPEELQALIAKQVAEAVATAMAAIPAPAPTPAPEPTPAPVAVADPPVADPAPAPSAEGPLAEQLRELAATVQESNRRMRLAEARASIQAALANVQLSPKGQEQVTARLMEASERREIDAGEIRVAIQESVDYEAGLLQTYFNPTGAGGARNIRIGQNERDKLVKGIEGFFRNEDIDGVPRIWDLREAYCRWNGIDFWSLNSLQMLKDMNAAYDSELNHAQITESLQTSSWGQVFADQMYTALIREYSIQPYTAWRAVVSDIERVTDFRVHHWARIGGYGNLTRVGEGQPYPTMDTPGDEEVAYQVSKYGGIDDVTWEATLSDGLNRIRRLPQEMALAAARTLYQFVLDLLTTTNPTMDYDGVTLYHSSHNNTGTSALTLGNLQLTSVAMRSQTRFGATDPLGPLNLPKILIVPNELEGLANRIANPSDAYVRDGASDTDVNLDPQAFKGRGLMVLVNDFLTDADNWYVVADPNVVPTVVLGFLNGRQDPELFVQDDPRVGSTFNADKISYKIRHIFGGDVLEHRSFYRQVV